MAPNIIEDQILLVITTERNIINAKKMGKCILENKLAYDYAGFGQTSLLQFRLVNVIDEVDASKSTNMQVGDKLKLLSFGKDLGDTPKFNNWIYNVPSSHDI